VRVNGSIVHISDSYIDVTNAAAVRLNQGASDVWINNSYLVSSDTDSDNTHCALYGLGTRNLWLTACHLNGGFNAFRMIVSGAFNPGRQFIIGNRFTAATEALMVWDCTTASPELVVISDNLFQSGGSDLDGLTDHGTRPTPPTATTSHDPALRRLARHHRLEVPGRRGSP
jgi:hypothetical protein